MKDIKSSFKTMRFKYGIFSAIATFAVLAVLVAINIIAGKMNLKIDLTREKLYSISDETKEIIRTLDEDVAIYTLYQTGTETSNENIIFWGILNQYQANSDKIKLENKDPELYTAFTGQFSKSGQPVEKGDIILQSGTRSKVIPSTELYIEDSASITLEHKVTNGLIYVTRDTDYTAYELTGHNEAGISSVFQSYMEDAGFDVKTADLSGLAGVPEDCDVLIFTTPMLDINDESTWQTADLSEAEADKLLVYLQGGGKAMFLIDYLPLDLPNLKSVMSAYGIQYDNFYILEGDSNYYHPAGNMYIIPSIAKHAITDNIISSQLFTMLFAPNGISVLDNTRSTLTVEPLLQTSSLAYGKYDPYAESWDKEQGDTDGPFYVAVAVTDSNNGLETKITAAGSSVIANEYYDDEIGGGNREFFIMSLNWLTGKADSVYIPFKNIDTSYSLSLTSNQSRNIVLFGIVILPVIILGFGFFVWSRRRNK